MSNKTEILSFDEWINGNGFNFRPEQYDLYKFLYESGQQSKQAEIEELKKQIDDALKNISFEQWSDEYGDFQTPTYNLIKILKGEETK